MSRADLIPLALLRDLAARLPDPIRPASFIDLAVFVSGKAPNATKASAMPAPTAETPSDAKAAAAPALGSVTTDKKGLPWALEELAQARELLAGGKGPSEVARILGRPVAATQIAIKRYGVRGTGPIKVPGRPKGRFKKAEPANLIPPVPAQGAKAVPDAKPTRPVTSRETSSASSTGQSQPLPVASNAQTPAASTLPKRGIASDAAVKDPDAKQARIRATLQAAVAENQPGRQVRVLSHLLTLPSDVFGAADDLFLAEGLASRRAVAEIADQLGCEPAAVTARWKAMLFADITDRHGLLLLDGQADLLRALRWLAEQEAAARV